MGARSRVTVPAAGSMATTVARWPPGPCQKPEPPTCMYNLSPVVLIPVITWLYCTKLAVLVMTALVVSLHSRLPSLFGSTIAPSQYPLAATPGGAADEPATVELAPVVT